MQPGSYSLAILLWQVFLEEVLELLFGKHGINDLKNGGFIFFVQLVDQV